MERYFKRKLSQICEDENPPILSNACNVSELFDKPSTSTNPVCEDVNVNVKLGNEIDTSEYPIDPGLRKNIDDYHPNIRDSVRRYYLQKGPFQPINHEFPQTLFGKKMRRFNQIWFNDHKSWLEYSIHKDAAFCLFCYLYRNASGDQSSGVSFDMKGFRNWKKKDRFQVHVGLVNSAHNIARRKCEDLMNQEQNIRFAFTRITDQMREDYRTRLTASVDCVRFLLRQGLAFRGHNESDNSNNQGNFLELLHFVANHNDKIGNVILKNAPQNNKLIAPYIQKEITNAAAVETSHHIINELRNEHFSILLDESRDVSVKEQVAIVVRYVDKRGCIIERFLGLVHVKETSALTLKEAIQSLFAKYELSIAQLRGQGYDGASNMCGEFNGLKTLILKENNSAYYIHCFAHQLQLALVAVAKNHVKIASFFNTVTNLVNIIGSSCKRRDILREKQLNKVVEQLSSEEVLSGKGLNQETSIQRAGDTRWGSHFASLVSIIHLYASIIDILDIIVHDGVSGEQRGEAYALLDSIQCFEFIFNLHMMKFIMSITNELSQVLQKKDQDIINAIILVRISKERLQSMRNAGWENLIAEVEKFCLKNAIITPIMTENFVMRGRSRRNTQVITNLHHYQVELLYSVIDTQLQELNNRFDEINTELLLCVACLNPCDSFSAFNKQRLIQLAKFYPSDFSEMDIITLDSQLENYIIDMKSSDSFLKLKGFGELAQKLVETKKNDLYPLVFLLVKLVLLLPIATATVERAFSAMKIVKNRLRNRMGDSWMNDCLITYIEKEIFDQVDNESIIQRFQNMKTRREKL